MSRMSHLWIKEEGRKGGKISSRPPFIWTVTPLISDSFVFSDLVTRSRNIRNRRYIRRVVGLWTSGHLITFRNSIPISVIKLLSDLDPRIGQRLLLTWNVRFDRTGLLGSFKGPSKNLIGRIKRHRDITTKSTKSFKYVKSLRVTLHDIRDIMVSVRYYRGWKKKKKRKSSEGSDPLWFNS